MPPAAKKKQKEEGAPAWMVTFGDMMSLLLCFFVMLLAMSEIRKDQKFREVLESIRQAFGYDAGLGQIPSNKPATLSILRPKKYIVMPTEPQYWGEIVEENFDGEKVTVQTVRDGLKIILGGRVTFTRFRAELSPTAQKMIARIAQALQGHNNKIDIRGHTTREPLPQDSSYADLRDLSYARAKAVGQALIGHGVDPPRVRYVACGNTERLVKNVYNEKTRAVNRRVEIVVRESLVEDYQATSRPVFERSVNNG